MKNECDQIISPDSHPVQWTHRAGLVAVATKQESESFENKSKQSEMSFYSK